jgi:hypothetical protein
VVLVVALLAVMVNLPLVHSTVTHAEVARPLVLLGVTLAFDLLLVGVIVLAVRYGGRARIVEAVALADVQRCPPGGVLEQVDDGRWDLRGEVVEIAPDRVVLDLGERRVLVYLDGHANPVGYQQPARVAVRLVMR